MSAFQDLTSNQQQEQNFDNSCYVFNDDENNKVKYGTPANYYASFVNLQKENARIYKENMENYKIAEAMDMMLKDEYNVKVLEECGKKVYGYSELEYAKLQNQLPLIQHHIYKALAYQDEKKVILALDNLQNHLQKVMDFCEKYGDEGEFISACEDMKRTYNDEKEGYERFKAINWFQIGYTDPNNKNKHLTVRQFIKKYGYEYEKEFMKKQIDKVKVARIC
jgi:hypothetical protein